MARRDVPGAPGDGGRRVDDGQVELGLGSEAIEERAAVRRRLGEDRCDRHGVATRAELREPPFGAARGVTGDGSPPRAPDRSTGRKGRVDPQRAHRAPGPEEDSRGSLSRGAVGASERAQQRLVGGGCRFALFGWHRLAATEEPRELGVGGCEVGGDAADLAQRHLTLKRALEVAAALRRLPWMAPVEHERLRDVVPFRDLEDARPELVVLALEVRRVVAEAVPVEQLAVEHHRRVEERRREERVPANSAVAERHQVRASRPVGVVELEHGCSEDAQARARRHRAELLVEPRRERDVVRVEPRDVAAGGMLETEVERRREPEPLVVREKHDAVVRELVEQRGRLVGRPVVDDDEL